jgi:Na+-driven multidrug efflux pump
LLSAVDTMAPQAFGAGRVSAVGTLCMRGFLLCMMATVPAYFLWWRMEGLLLLVGQPAEVAALAGRFLKIYCFAVPPLLFVEVLRRFYQCQNIVKPFVWIIIVVAGVACGERFSTRFCTRGVLLSFTPLLRLKRCHACDQWHTSRESTLTCSPVDM